VSIASAVRSPYRFFEVRLARARSLSPTFVRVTFAGHQLAAFADCGTDQRIKIAVPLPGTGIAQLPMTGTSWYDDWRALPDQQRNPLRTYTVSAVRQDRAEIDVDVVRHVGGLASSWLTEAATGAETAILGPNARHPGPYGGQIWNPPTGAGRVLLIGDETAVPAVANICAEMSRDTVGEVLLEVPQPADFLELDPPPGVMVTWLARGTADYGNRLLDAVGETARRVFPGPASPPATISDRASDSESGSEPDIVWEVPEEGPGAASSPYAWVAGEAGVVRRLRRLLVSEHGATRRELAVMGYWRRGQSEGA
jgi:NADPH-dependent ferric siderophore reductase